MPPVVTRLLSVIAPPLCWACGAPSLAAEPLCRACRRELRPLSSELCHAGGVQVWAPLAYDGPARALVHALKYRGAVAVAGAMAASIAACAPGGLLEGRALVPVPLHPARFRRRGFNQAERLAAAIGARTDRPVVDCLERVAASAPQVGRGRADRLRAPPGSVRLRPGVAVPQRPLLVDDVVTTGATAAACAAALRSAGCPGAQAMAYARTPGR